jgi:hypothetical protein
MSTQPAILYGQISFPANAVGKFAMINGLWNRNSFGILIHKLIFTNGGTTSPVIGLTRVRMECAGEPITNGDVPISAFCYPDSPQSIEYSVNRYQIRLARPIYLGPGERIAIEAVRPTGSGADSGAAVTATTYTVAAIGSRALTPPAKRSLPYFAAFVGASRVLPAVASPADFAETSTESDLRNPFATPLFVDRFIGRIYYRDGLNPLWVEAYVNVPTYDLTATQFKVRIEDHLGNFVVRAPTSHAAVFDFPTRSWPVKTALAPRGFYRVTHEGTLRVIQSGPPTGRALPVTGMIGYREIGR